MHLFPGGVSKGTFSRGLRCRECLVPQRAEHRAIIQIRSHIALGGLVLAAQGPRRRAPSGGQGLLSNPTGNPMGIRPNCPGGSSRWQCEPRHGLGVLHPLLHIICEAVLGMLSTHSFLRWTVFCGSWRFHSKHQVGVGNQNLCVLDAHSHLSPKARLRGTRELNLLAVHRGACQIYRGVGVVGATQGRPLLLLWKRKGWAAMRHSPNVIDGTGCTRCVNFRDTKTFIA